MDERRTSEFSHPREALTPVSPEQHTSEVVHRDFSPPPHLETRVEYLQKVNPRKKKRRGLGLLITLLILLLLAAGGAVGYVKFWKPRTTTKAPPAVVQQVKPAPDAKITTEHIDSTNFSLGLDYPTGWKVADNGDGKLTVTSPAGKQKTASGQETYVRTVLTITPKGQKLTIFDKGNAGAVRDSEKISYSQPTSVQRAQTYISFVQNSATTIPDALDGIYVTGDFGYQKSQAIPQTDVAKLDPLIVVSFEACGDADCRTIPTPTNLPASSWDNTSLKNPILVMLKSISIN